MIQDRQFHQVAFVVADLDEAVRRWSDVVGTGPWSVYTIDARTLPHRQWAGKAADFSFRHALAWSGAVQFELVQPVHGPSIFADQLSEAGDVFSHVGLMVENHETAVRDYRSRGFTVLQSGRGFGQSENGAFTYLRDPTGTGPIVELISPPQVRNEPDYIYPELMAAPAVEASP